MTMSIVLNLMLLNNTKTKSILHAFGVVIYKKCLYFSIDLSSEPYSLFDSHLFFFILLETNRNQTYFCNLCFRKTSVVDDGSAVIDA